MPKNPSEIARLEQELDYAWERLTKGINSRSTKEYILREIRELERTLGIEHKPYNGV